MLTIRLQRMGKTKKPTYRLIVSENHKDTQAGSLEILGQYNPLTNPKVVELKADRINHWIAQGATMSNTVHNLLATNGVIKADKKQKAVSISKKRQGKIDAARAEEEEKRKQKEEEKRQAEEAAKAEAEAAAEAEKTEAEAPSEEAPAAEEAPAEEEKKEEAPAETEEAEKKDA